ncbi:MAG: FAD-dependent monooxygenase, partial [Pseudomonadota bacterium]
MRAALIQGERECRAVSDDPITIVGAGVLGLWQSLLLARAGHRVQLVERDATPFQSAA